MPLPALVTPARMRNAGFSHAAGRHETENVDPELLVRPLHRAVENYGLADWIALAGDDAVGRHFPPRVFDKNIPGGAHRVDIVAVEAMAVGKRAAHAALTVLEVIEPIADVRRHVF